MVTNAEYNKAKNAVNNQYTEESIQNYTNAYNNYMKQGLSSADALAKAKGLLVDKNTTPTNIPTQNATQTTGSTVSKTNNSNATKVSGNTVLPEYQGSGNQNKVQTSYANQGNGNYAYNPTSGYYEKNNNQNYNTIRDAWDSKTYEQQQELLKNNPNLKEGITKVGGTIKQSPYQNQGEGQYQYNPKTGYYEKQGSQGGNETPTNKGDWDYQDNSPERTAEIIRNLDDLSKSNPGLFSDYDTFYNAFIAGKGRSPEQIKVLNDYFNKMKQYNKYDNLSSDAVGQGIAQGLIPDEYLSYLKYNDPQRYAEIQEARKGTETQIMNEGNLITIAESAGYDMGTGSNFWKWNTTEMGFRDVNNDGLDDRLYHEPSEEEKRLWEEDANYEAERLKIQNAYKDLQSDLTDQYPDADLSTIMVLTSDRGNKMLKAMDTLNVSQTKVQGMIKYMQNERATQDKAGLNTITELQKNLGMYYDYTPEGMSELAQAQYAATNVTLDQADNGTDTQKQMALDKVLSDYYDKYGSIIQRSKNQVINDVMAYAKNHGVSLSQALEENFLKYLREKPGFKQLNSVTNNPDVFKIGDDIYGYWDENGNLVPIGGYLGGGTSTPGEVAGSEWSNGNQVKLGEEVADTGIKNVYGSNVKLAPTVGKMLQSAYDTLAAQGIQLQVGDSYRSYETQKKAYEEDQAKPANQRKGVAAPGKSFHEIGQAVDIAQNQMNDPAVIQAMLDAGFTRPVKSEPWHWSYGEGKDMFGGVASQTPKDILNNKFVGDPDRNPNGYFNSMAKILNSAMKDGTVDLTDKKWESLKNSYGINDKEFYQMVENYANSDLLTSGGSQASRALESAIETYQYLYGPSSSELDRLPNGHSWLGRQVSGIVPTTDVGMAKGEFDTLMDRLTLKELFDAKSLGATFGAMSKDEWEVLRNAATNLKRGNGNFKKQLENLIESLYDATNDGHAGLPKNWEGSQAQQMINNRINNKSGIGKYENSNTNSNGAIKAPKYVQTKQDVYDDEWDAVA